MQSTEQRLVFEKLIAYLSNLKEEIRGLQPGITDEVIFARQIKACEIICFFGSKIGDIGGTLDVLLETNLLESGENVDLESEVNEPTWDHAFDIGLPELSLDFPLELEANQIFDEGHENNGDEEISSWWLDEGNEDNEDCSSSVDEENFNLLLKLEKVKARSHGNWYLLSFDTDIPTGDEDGKVVGPSNFKNWPRVEPGGNSLIRPKMGCKLPDRLLERMFYWPVSYIRGWPGLDGKIWLTQVRGFTGVPLLLKLFDPGGLICVL